MTGRVGRIRLLLVCCVGLSCARPAPPPAAEPAVPADALRSTSEAGPVKVTLTLSPPKPRLGDRLTLTLSAEAPAQVTVELPPFGEALGRFTIVSFTPRSETLPGGATRLSQRYVLDPPMSGAQRVPPLRIEFTDHRPGAAADGGAARELYTDELPVQVRSVLPEGALGAELRPLRDALPESSPARRWWPLPAAGGALVAGALLLRAFRRRRVQRLRVSAYDQAMGRLLRLLDRGPPAAEEADRFYVELSDIVRRYIEDRYGVRAPELTTEEFLREARHLQAVGDGQRRLLEAFLSTCDRVKFAGYRPAADESRGALGDARRFLEETRPRGPEARP